MEKILRYPSIAALANDAERKQARAKDNRLGWFGGESFADSIRFARFGDDRLVADAELLLSQINAAIDIPERPMIADVAGAYPVVGDYLAGMPDCMRRRATVENDESPIRLFVCNSSSHQITAAEFLRRGVAIVALTLALSRVRSIELHIVGINRNKRSGNEVVITAPINAQPLDLATACYVLTSAGFARRLCYGLAFGDSRNLVFPDGYGSQAYADGLMRRLGADPQRDLWIDGAHSSDALLNDPVAWVNRQIARFCGESVQ